MASLDTVRVRLAPFFVLAVAYVVASPPPSIIAILLKCLPLACLCGFVITDTLSPVRHSNLIYRYNIAIIAGLVLSGIGDAALVYVNNHDLFVIGLLFFALAHLSYIIAFGWRPVNVKALLICFTLMCLGYSMVYQGLVKHNLASLGGLYSVLLMLMGWRALAGARLTDNRWSLTKMAAPVGAIFFCISDFVLAMNRFYTPIPSSQMLVMSTYYAGQLGIALSVLDRDFNT
nr:lysoplasmalogenase-like protein TMEM86A [Lytechinus pictus]